MPHQYIFNRSYPTKTAPLDRLRHFPAPAQIALQHLGEGALGKLSLLWSQLHRHLRYIFLDACASSEDVFQLSLFLQRLSGKVRATLSTFRDDYDLDDMARAANRYMEASTSTVTIIFCASCCVASGGCSSQLFGNRF